MKKISTITSSIILAVLLLSVGNAHATSTLTLGTQYSNIYSVVNGTAQVEGGGSISNSSLDGRSLDYLYCLDLFHNITVGNTYSSTTINNTANINGSTLSNAGSVAYLLGKYGIGGQNDQSVALQAAIWHVIYAPGVYDLDTTKYTTPGSTVVTLYTKYIAEAAKNPTGVISNFLWINPGTNLQALVTSAPVPEPGTMMLLGFGMLGLAIYGKRRTNKEA